VVEGVFKVPVKVRSGDTLSLLDAMNDFHSVLYYEKFNDSNTATCFPVQCCYNGILEEEYSSC